MGSDLHPALPQSMRKVYQIFAAQDPVTPVFLVRCCGRIYMGRDPASKCRTCDDTPKNVEIRNEADLDNL